MQTEDAIHSKNNLQTFPSDTSKTQTCWMIVRIKNNRKEISSSQENDEEGKFLLC